MLSADKAEDVRWIGIYFGPVILASILGNAVLGAVFRTTAINIGGMPLFMNLMFAVVGSVIAWRMTDTLGRIAWAVFVLYQGIQLVAAFSATRIGGPWNLGLIGLFAVLATASGIRSASRHAVLIVVGIFLFAAVAVFGARYYADALLGSYSVIR
jgi:hypothetical protein